MSVNKILALIGSIFSTIFAAYWFFVGLAGGLAFLAIGSGNMYYSDTAEIVVGVLFVGLAIIAMAATILNWVAFSHLDTAKEKPWKIYFLVMGIISCLSAFGIITFLELIPGVLFILAFALNGSANKARSASFSAAPATAVTNPEMSAWPETVTADAAVTQQAVLAESSESLKAEKIQSQALSSAASSASSVPETEENPVVETQESASSFAWVEKAADSEEEN